MLVGRICPKCRSFDVREVPVQGDDLHGYRCHDCHHAFYISSETLQREQADQEAGKVVRLPSPRKRS